jgi:hypothetical protein
MAALHSSRRTRVLSSTMRLALSVLLDVLSSNLVRHGLALFPKMTTDVNEQNTQTIGFDGLNKK